MATMMNARTGRTVRPGMNGLTGTARAESCR
jgi:hypothetical protein